MLQSLARRIAQPVLLSILCWPKWTGSHVHCTGISSSGGPVLIHALQSILYPVICPASQVESSAVVEVSPKKSCLGWPQTCLWYMSASAGSGLVWHLHQPVHILEDRAAWSVSPQPYISPKLTASAAKPSQPATEMVFIFRVFKHTETLENKYNAFILDIAIVNMPYIYTYIYIYLLIHVYVFLFSCSVLK